MHIIEIVIKQVMSSSFATTRNRNRKSSRIKIKLQQKSVEIFHLLIGADSFAMNVRGMVNIAASLSGPIVRCSTNVLTSNFFSQQYVSKEPRFEFYFFYSLLHVRSC